MAPSASDGGLKGGKRPEVKKASPMGSRSEPKGISSGDTGDNNNNNNKTDNKTSFSQSVLHSNLSGTTNNQLSWHEKKLIKKFSDKTSSGRIAAGGSR